MSSKAPLSLKRSSFSVKDLRSYSFIKPRSCSFIDHPSTKNEEQLQNYTKLYGELKNEKKQVQKKYVDLFRETYDIVFVVYRDSGMGTYLRNALYITEESAEQYVKISHQSDDWYHAYYIKKVAVVAITDDDIWRVKLE